MSVLERFCSAEPLVVPRSCMLPATVGKCQLAQLKPLLQLGAPQGVAEAPEDDPMLAANMDIFFSALREWQNGHSTGSSGWLTSSSNDLPHSSHLYSNSGMLSLLISYRHDRPDHQPQSGHQPGVTGNLSGRSHGRIY